MQTLLEGNPVADPFRTAELTANQKVKLKDLVRYNLQSVRAYLLKEDFQQLWNYESTAWAAKFLDQWCRQVMRSRIEPMKKVARTLRAHRELILNYFRARKEFSSGLSSLAWQTARTGPHHRFFSRITLVLRRPVAHTAPNVVCAAFRPSRKSPSE